MTRYQRSPRGKSAGPGPARADASAAGSAAGPALAGSPTAASLSGQPVQHRNRRAGRRSTATATASASIGSGLIPAGGPPPGPSHQPGRHLHHPAAPSRAGPAPAAGTCAGNPPAGTMDCSHRPTQPTGPTTVRSGIVRPTSSSTTTVCVRSGELVPIMNMRQPPGPQRSAEPLHLTAAGAPQPGQRRQAPIKPCRPARHRPRQGRTSRKATGQAQNFVRTWPRVLTRRRAAATIPCRVLGWQCSRLLTA